MTVKLINHRKDNEKEFETVEEAQEKKNDMISLGVNSEDLEIIENGDTPPEGETKDESQSTRSESESDAKEATPVMNADGKPQKTSATHPEEFNLPDQPGVDTDPLDWVPSDFIDHIEGKPAINRKGYDVLAHHYNISVETDVLVSPSETDFTYAEVVATATTEDGIEYKAHGSAHVDRGDDSYLLLEMSDTRAAKRATARATGVGMVAVEELQNEP